MHDECAVENCAVKADVTRLEARVNALEDWQEGSRDFHTKFYDWQREQIARDARLDEKLSNMDRNLLKLVEREDAQTDSRKKRWDAIIDKCIWAVLAAVIAFLLAKAGL